MYEITQVDALLFRSPRPTKQKLSCWQLAYAIGAVLNLEGDAPDAVRQEVTDCGDLGIDELRLGMSGLSRPTKEQLLTGLHYIQENQKRKIPVVVHCLHGVDRTGLVCATYRILVQGWSVEDAWAEALRFGLHWYVYFWWKKSLYELKGGG